MTTVLRELLMILACPECKETVPLSEQKNGLIDKSCGLLYPIRNDIPVMLVGEAVKV